MSQIRNEAKITLMIDRKNFLSLLSYIWKLSLQRTPCQIYRGWNGRIRSSERESSKYNNNILGFRPVLGGSSAASSRLRSEESLWSARSEGVGQPEPSLPLVDHLYSIGSGVVVVRSGKQHAVAGLDPVICGDHHHQGPVCCLIKHYVHTVLFIMKISP